MAGTRALFASIGAGVALIAAAALSLLTISAVFAFGGWSDSVSRSVTQPALVFAGANSDDPQTAQTVASASRAQIVAPAPPSRPEPRPARAGSDRSTTRATAPAATSVSARGSGTPPELDVPVRPPPPPATVPTAQKSGDHVRKVGESLSSTVQNAGTALSDVAQPLAPPVSAAVQQVLNLVAEIVRRASGGLGGTLDALLPKK